MINPDPLQYSWWLASRAAGIVAFVLFSIAVIAGLTMASRLASTPARKRAILQVHEHAALAGLIAVCVHGITLLGDHWLNPGLTGITVPFVIAYRPLAVASGIVSAYLATALGLSFYIRRRIGAARWRKLHQFTLLAWGLGFLHVLFAGTDAHTLWMRLIYLWTAGPIVVLLGARITAGRRKARREARAPRRAPAGTPAAPGWQTPTPSRREPAAPRPEPVRAMHASDASSRGSARVSPDGWDYTEGSI